MIPFIKQGELVPFGFSRSTGLLRLRLPIFAWKMERYEILSDKMHKGWWIFSVTIRIGCRRGIQSGWTAVGVQRRKKVLYL